MNNGIDVNLSGITNNRNEYGVEISNNDNAINVNIASVSNGLAISNFQNSPDGLISIHNLNTNAHSSLFDGLEASVNNLNGRCDAQDIIINNKANCSDIPTKISDLINDSNFIDSTSKAGKAILKEYSNLNSQLFTINSGNTDSNGNSDILASYTSGTQDIPWKMPEQLSANGSNDVTLEYLGNCTPSVSSVDINIPFTSQGGDFGAETTDSSDVIKITFESIKKISAIYVKSIVGDSFDTCGNIEFYSDSTLNTKLCETNFTGKNQETTLRFPETSTSTIFITKKENSYLRYNKIEIYGTNSEVISGANKIYFKSGGKYAPLVGTTGKGESIELEIINPIETTTLSDGTYNIFVEKNGTNYALLNTVYKQKLAPNSPEQNAIWINNGMEPKYAYIFNGTNWVKYNGVYIGKVSVSNGLVANVKTEPFNSKYTNTNLSHTTPAVVIDSYVSSGNGYRIWNDGYCEQWGMTSLTAGSLTTITLLKKFVNTRANIMAVVRSGMINNCTMHCLQTGTDQFTLGGNNTANAFWRAWGYLAEGEY